LAVPKRFFLRTYGCQMNAHDSEKVANLLYHAGYVAGEDAETADVLIINTCSIRDKAERRLYSDLGMLRTWKAAAPGRVLGVAGCVAQQEGDAIQRRYPHVDFVFGTHNLRLVPAMLEAHYGVPMLGAVLLALGLQLGVIYVPALNDVFATQPLPAFDLAVCLALSSLVLVAVELEKALVRRGRLYGEPLTGP